MNPDEFCTSDQWSVLSAAASHSQFAGVLGGFLITAIALLMDKKSRESIHTLALFSSAVLVLMLSSFLFSLISGNQTPAEGDARGICAIAWTQGAVSTGMLAAGATAFSVAWVGCLPATPSTGCPSMTPTMSARTAFSLTWVAG